MLGCSLSDRSELTQARLEIAFQLFIVNAAFVIEHRCGKGGNLFLVHLKRVLEEFPREGAVLGSSLFFRIRELIVSALPAFVEARKLDGQRNRPDIVVDVALAFVEFGLGELDGLPIVVNLQVVDMLPREQRIEARLVGQAPGIFTQGSVIARLV